ncbi:hypothetical protein Taro_021682 [Colocasia esculenta]|uniref:Uncharacterized protein n=1 Tax=Colocasia esculenta TaxID=4460 RepID=A0A843UZP2_COLES|nr:hypothetical protein [Colocasia esculenta]
MAADYWLAASPLDADPDRRPHPWTSACGWRPDLWTSISFTWNNPQKTTELFSFGRPKEEKTRSRLHPLRESTQSTEGQRGQPETPSSPMRVRRRPRAPERSGDGAEMNRLQLFSGDHGRTAAATVVLLRPGRRQEK